MIRSALKLTILALVLTGCQQDQEKQVSMENGFYIGTYTQGESMGIYYAELDQQNGAIRDLKLAAETPNPSFLAFGNNRKFLYAVNEDLGLESTQDAGISAFRVEGPGQLRETGIVSSGGAYACYLTVSKGERYLLAANYGGGNIISVPLESPGAFGQESQVVQHQGSGPDTVRQQRPHAHSIVLDPEEKFALAADLGIDRIMIYRVKEGQLVPNDPAFAELDPGSGPRHIEFHPKLNILYVISELSNTVTVFDYDPDKGSLAWLQTVSTLPDDYVGESYCADIHIHPNGKFLYGSNRGHDSLVIFAVDDDGRISTQGFFSEGVEWPRNFAISPDGNWILVANQNGNDIITARIDKQTGLLSATGYRLEVPSPVCIEF